MHQCIKCKECQLLSEHLSDTATQKLAQGNRNCTTLSSMSSLSRHLSPSLCPRSTAPLTPAPPSTAFPSPIQTPETVRRTMSLCRIQCLHSLYPVALTAQLQKKSTGNVNYIALDFQPVSQSPHREPSTSSVTTDEKGECLQKGKKRPRPYKRPYRNGPRCSSPQDPP